MSVRSLYYWARMYGDQLVVGENYKSLKHAVSINVLGYSYEDEDTWHNEYRVLNIENHKELTNHLRIVFLDLVKFEARRVQEMSDLELWGAFFSRKVSDEELKEASIMAEAMVAEKYFTADAALRYKYEQREKFLRDQRSRENRAIEKGDKERLLKDIRNLMDSLNWSADKAMQALKLSPEEQSELLPLL